MMYNNSPLKTEGKFDKLSNDYNNNKVVDKKIAFIEFKESTGSEYVLSIERDRDIMKNKKELIQK